MRTTLVNNFGHRSCNQLLWRLFSKTKEDAAFADRLDASADVLGDDDESQ